MREIFLVTFFCALCNSLAAQINELITPFEQDTSYSVSVEEAHAWYEKLASVYPGILVSPFGITDGQLPLYEVVIGRVENLNPQSARSQGKSILLINNAIHPGESCGVDASMLLARKLVSDPKWEAALDHITIVIIPYYNADGGLYRSPTYRANQNGPRLQGFRGNAKNLDLNRDFMKTDSYNARSFARLFRRWDPDLFIDTHTSNGADYPYTMTLIPTQPDKLPHALAVFQQEITLPYLYDEMALTGWPMCPYIHGDHSPDKGIKGFMDLPRYSTGYSSLFQCLGFMTEAHMLKPFASRVDATLQFMEHLITFASKNKQTLLKARDEARQQALKQEQWPLKWQIDSSRQTTFAFHGYEEAFAPSAVSGLIRQFYDQAKPYTRNVPYFPYYKPIASVQKPAAYIIPQAWHEVIERLQLQQIQMNTVERDTQLLVTQYRIRDLKTSSSPYEGHFPHSQVTYDSISSVQTIRAGDFIVPTDQAGVAFIIHALEPTAPDSWFAWNFFDPILNQKEYFSAYLWEDQAAQLLEENQQLREELNDAIIANPALADNPHAQLDWVYKHSAYYEPTHRLYPVYRLER